MNSYDNIMVSSKKIHNKNKIRQARFGFFFELFKNRQLYIMALPAMILLFAFNYLPLFGLILAFKNFKVNKGIFGSDWMNPIYGNFQFLFSSSQAIRAIRNTLFLNGLFIIAGTLMAVGFALLLNEVGNNQLKRSFQTVSFLPYFISWIVVGVFVYNLFNSEYGSINMLLSSLGMEKVDWFSTPEAWPGVLTLIYLWKNMGYNVIIYLATLTGIDIIYYEAAKIDGATRMQQIIFVSLPLLKPTIIIMTLLSLGKILNADFGMFFSTVGDASLLYPTTDVIDTFVYRALRVTGDIGMASATGFFQSILSFILVFTSNLVVRKINEDSALF